MLITPDHSPQQALTDVHDQLKRAAVDTKHNFRFFSVATSGLADQPAQSRMVVLRSFTENWEFEFYTDHRSSKVEEIKKRPVLSALFWDPSKRVQVRIEAGAEIHHQNELAKERWTSVQGGAQKAYNSPVTPGRQINQPDDAHQWPKQMDDSYFAVVSCKASCIKVLQISGMEHLALQYDRKSSGSEWIGTWIAP